MGPCGEMAAADYLRYLGRDEEGKKKVYRFGITCSPFLLGAAIKYQIDRDKGNYIKRLRGSFYVDNCVTSVNSRQKLDGLIKEAIFIINKGRKFLFLK